MFETIIIILIILIVDKIVAITPVSWDDLIVTSVKKIITLVKKALNSMIDYLIVNPMKKFFSKKSEDVESNVDDSK